MGREIKRVPMDFDWPLDKIWKGYVNPHYSCCAKCEGSGVTAARKRVEELARLFLLSGEDARRDKCHPYFSWGAMHQTYGKTPSKDMSALSTGLAGREPSGFGHDSIDGYRATKKIIAAAGLDPETWGTCEECDGTGENLKTKEASDAWESYHPPIGESYQLWSTTTEGHPMSPPKATPQELARWLVDNNASSFGHDTATYEQWLKFIDAGWAPSMVYDGETIVDGVNAA